MAHHFPDRKEFKEQFFTLLKPEAGFYKVVLVYSLAISLLTLAVPLSVQLLVDTVANIALPRAVFLIASLLFALLFFSGVMYALRADGFNAAETKAFADSVRQQLLRVQDVAKVELFGVQDEKVFVEVSQKRLSQMGLDMTTVLGGLFMALEKQFGAGRFFLSQRMHDGAFYFDHAALRERPHHHYCHLSCWPQ